ncbi:hypothetical protein niasHS_012061 [Heterodera schachtii]|uniref:RAD50-interacting protein 1 n=1 Tax=Heterodera schachtii TaxID=97005 RepID=A0ABD2IDF8_HETSC
MDPYFSSNVLRVRERLAELNTKDLREYFKGFRKIYSELLTQKEEHKAEIIVQKQSLREFKQKLQKLREYLTMVRRIVTEENSRLSVKYSEVFEQIKEEAPELAEKLEQLQKMQRRLAYLKFSKNFTVLLAEVRKYLRKGNYLHLLDNYRKLLQIPRNSPEYSMDAHCRHEYAVKSDSLARFLQLELCSALSTIFSRIHFPFEEPVDLNSLHFPLHQSAQIIKCLQLVTSETVATTSQSKDNQPKWPIELVLDEFRKRFDYHFYGDRPTNNATKPEWFFTQLSYWAENNIEYFEQYIQPIADELFSHGITERTARDIFLQLLMSLASQKVSEIIGTDRILENRHQLSHLIDETVMFEKEFQQNFGYSEEAPVHVVSQLCQSEEVLEKWIKLERDTLWAGIDAILADEQAYEPRYKEAADVDPYLLPNFADSFVILMQSMSERYRSIPELRLQCRFLKLQLVIVDEFRSRIVQIGQNILHNPWERPYPQLINALWYLSLVLDDWSESPEFVRLQFHLQSGPASTSHSTESTISSGVNSLARGTFDESAGLYRHVWRQWVRNLCDVFAETIRLKLTQYANERWDEMKQHTAQPNEVTPSLGPFLRKVQQLLGCLTAQISPDSVLTLHHLTNHEVWSALDECIVTQTPFNCRGAAQLLFDVTTTVIPLLISCYGKVKGSAEFDVFGEKCVFVLSTLRILSLSPPTAILLKDELKHIPEHQLNEKLEQFNVSGMTKARVSELLERRCDLVPLEKLIS